MVHNFLLFIALSISTEFNKLTDFLQFCVGKPFCDIVVQPASFGGDPCPGSLKKLSVEVQCS